MVSVIMLTYNREKLIKRAIKSILGQTFHDFEFIIVNNGSTDNSGLIADQYAKRDNRIFVIHKQRGNIGSGRNMGLNAAKGELISFIDDDDWVEPDYLEFLHALIIKNDADVAICGSADKVFNEKKIMTTEESLIELMWRKKYNVAFPAKLFKSSLFMGIRFSETSKYDDIELMPKILGKANKVVYHGLPKYTFYRHEGNNSAWTTNHSLLNVTTLNEYLRVYRERTEWLCFNFPNNDSVWRYFEWSFMISMMEKINRLKLTDCIDLYNYLLQILQLNYNDFINCKYIQDFEKEWMIKYAKPANTK